MANGGLGGAPAPLQGCASTPSSRGGGHPRLCCARGWYSRAGGSPPIMVWCGRRGRGVAVHPPPPPTLWADCIMHQVHRSGKAHRWKARMSKWRAADGRVADGRVAQGWAGVAGGWTKPGAVTSLPRRCPAARVAEIFGQPPPTPRRGEGGAGRGRGGSASCGRGGPVGGDSPPAGAAAATVQQVDPEIVYCAVSIEEFATSITIALHVTLHLPHELEDSPLISQHELLALIFRVFESCSLSILFIITFTAFNQPSNRTCGENSRHKMEIL